MKRESVESLCGYRFYVLDDAKTLKPFLNEEDRRIASIQNACHSRIYLTSETRLRKGQRKRAVLVRAHSRRDLETCLRRLDDTFPHLYACSNLTDAKAAIQLIEIRKYHTNEDLFFEFHANTITYYQLTFNFDSGDVARYEHWRKTPDAQFVKKLGCTLLVAAKDTPGAGFLRRYALVSGESRRNVVASYYIFRTTFAHLPELDDGVSI